MYRHKDMHMIANHTSVDEYVLGRNLNPYIPAAMHRRCDAIVVSSIIRTLFVLATLNQKVCTLSSVINEEIDCH